MERRMSDLPLPTKRRGKGPAWAWVMLGAGGIYLVIASQILRAYPHMWADFSPSLAPLLDAGWIVQTHVAGALSAFFIGVIILSLPKGRGLHKPMGWSWIAAMTVTAVSSFFMTGLNSQTFSLIHALSAWTMIGLPMGVAAIRGRKVKLHAKRMTGMFLGGMGIAGLFTFLPGRLMWSLLFAV
jgi:uncharacterized membrane protein